MPRPEPHSTAELVSSANSLPLRAVSLFCGAGGFCAGVQMAGYGITCAVETDPDAVRTHEANFPGVSLFAGDIANFLNRKPISTAAEQAASEEPIELVFGGPPCQGFSQIGPRNPADPRNQLYRQFVRVVKRLQPSAFIMENVPNMLSMDGGRFRNKILLAFKRAGFARAAVLDLVASDYGVPQERRRIFVVGVRDSIALEGRPETLCQQYLATYRTSKSVSVWQAISDLPVGVSTDDGPLAYPTAPKGRPSSYQALMRLDRDGALLSAEAKRAQLGEQLALYNHHTKGMEGRRQKIVSMIGPGMTGACLPREVWKGVRSHKWRRLNPDKPSYTILAQMSRDLSEWIHPYENRWITVREAARLQSFHDGFIFCGSEYQQLKQVGNAVPPLLGYAVASAVRHLLAFSRCR